MIVVYLQVTVNRIQNSAYELLWPYFIYAIFYLYYEGKKMLEKILLHIEELKVEVGESTDDGKFSINCLRCVGACGLAPVVTVGEKVFGRVAPSQVKKIIAAYRESVAADDVKSA